MTFRNVRITGFNSRNTIAAVLFGGAHVVFENSLLHGNTGFGSNVLYATRITLLNSTITDNVASSLSNS